MGSGYSRPRWGQGSSYQSPSFTTKEDGGQGQEKEATAAATCTEARAARIRSHRLRQREMAGKTGGHSCSRPRWGQRGLSWPSPLALKEREAKAKGRRARLLPPRAGTRTARSAHSPLSKVMAVSLFSQSAAVSSLGSSVVKGTGVYSPPGSSPPPAASAQGAHPRAAKTRSRLFLGSLPCGGGGQHTAQTPLQRARLEAPPTAGSPASPLPPSLHNRRGQPYGRPLPTHWASILRWCPPGGRRVPWSPRRWRR